MIVCMVTAALVPAGLLLVELDDLGPDLGLLVIILPSQALPFVTLSAFAQVMSPIGFMIALVTLLAGVLWGDWETHKVLYDDPVASVGFILVPVFATICVFVVVAGEALVRLALRVARRQ